MQCKSAENTKGINVCVTSGILNILSESSKFTVSEMISRTLYGFRREKNIQFSKESTLADAD